MQQTNKLPSYQDIPKTFFWTLNIIKRTSAVPNRPQQTWSIINSTACTECNHIMQKGGKVSRLFINRWLTLLRWTIWNTVRMRQEETGSSSLSIHNTYVCLFTRGYCSNHQSAHREEINIKTQDEFLMKTKTTDHSLVSKWKMSKWWETSILFSVNYPFNMTDVLFSFLDLKKMHHSVCDTEHS